MEKYLPLLRQIAAILAKTNPKPFFDYVELEYGRTAKLALMVIVFLAAVLSLGYTAEGVNAWLGGF